MTTEDSRFTVKKFLEWEQYLDPNYIKLDYKENKKMIQFYTSIRPFYTSQTLHSLAQKIMNVTQQVIENSL